MSLIVQKFGGTSVADIEKIRAAARKAIRAQRQGHRVVMVVSAMGKNTDVLLDLAGQIGENPPAREMDMLLSTGEQVSVALVAMAIHDLGAKAISLTGGQIGMKTDNSFSKARIQSISTDRIERLLAAGNIVVAAGFQGIDDDLNITTLGRGGSDTTAVALAAVLGADACEIYTDVDGVYTTDPRKLPEARRVDVISYDEMLELASLGAGVMHSRSIEFAKKFGVPIHVRSSFSDTEGTMIVAEPESITQPVSGAAMTADEARVTVLGVPDVPGKSLMIFSAIAARKIAVDMVVQNVGQDGLADVSFTVPRGELKSTLSALDSVLSIIGASGITHDSEVSKVSVVGMNMATQTNVASRMFRALADAGVNIQMITTSEIKISTLVAKHQSAEALRAVHQAFDLHSRPTDAKSWKQIKADRSEANVETLINRLRRCTGGIDVDRDFVDQGSSQGHPARCTRQAGGRRGHVRNDRTSGDLCGHDCPGVRRRRRIDQRFLDRRRHGLAQNARSRQSDPKKAWHAGCSRCQQHRQDHRQRYRTSQPHARRHVAVRSFGDGPNQRRDDQHQRAAGERGDRRDPRRPSHRRTKKDLRRIADVIQL